jgi:hypothetical protein
MSDREPAIQVTGAGHNGGGAMTFGLSGDRIGRMVIAGSGVCSRARRRMHARLIAAPAAPSLAA